MLVPPSALVWPTACSGSAIDRDVRQALHDGILWCVERAGMRAEEYFGDGVPAGWVADPTDFATYYDWAVALDGASDGGSPDPDLAAVSGPFVDAFRASFQRGRVLPNDPQFPLPPGLEVIGLGDPRFDQADRERIIRWFNVEPESWLDIVSTEPEQLSRARHDVALAISGLSVWAPGFHAELLAVVRQLLLLRLGGRDDGAPRGGSSFALWGVLGADPEAHSRWWHWVPTLVHEAGHSVLFAVARHGPLLENDPSERFPSPVRDDLRPLDGIFHAAFVVTRELAATGECIGALQTGAEFDGFDQADRQAIISDFMESREASFRCVHDCIETLEQNARLTPMGRQILDVVRAELAAMR